VDVISLSDARRGPDWCVGGMGRRGAHGKQVVHVSEAGGVEAQRLVEHGRITIRRACPRVDPLRLRDSIRTKSVLPSPKAGIA